MPNTFDAALVVDVVSERTVTVLTSRLAALAGFSVKFDLDRLAPKKTVQVPLAKAGSTTLTNPTNWESGDSQLDNVAVAVDQYSQPFHLTNEQIQQGHSIERIVNINLSAFANKIMDVVLTPVTVANFGAASVTAAAAAFGADEMRALYGALKASDIKNAVLDSEYYARFLPEKLTDMGPRPGLCGFDLVIENSRWNGAGANIRGFACNPQAVAVGAALPVMAPGAEREFLDIRTIPIPSLDLSVEFSLWFSRAARTLWGSFDVMLGAKEADTSALKLVTDQ